MKYKETLIF